MELKTENFDHNLIKNCQLYMPDNLVSKELYNISLCSMKSLHHKATMKNYLKNQI